MIKDKWENVGDRVIDHNGKVVVVAREQIKHACTGCCYHHQNNCRTAIIGKYISRSPWVGCGSSRIIFRYDDGIEDEVESQQTITI